MLSTFLLFIDICAIMLKNNDMKKILFNLAVLISATLVLNSCYSYTSIVGQGAQGENKTTKWNHYVIYGLAPVGVSDSKKMAGDAENYTIQTQQTFVNGLISALTFGIYTPTTTTVKK